MKGTISQSLQEILSDDEGRKQLRRLLATRTDGKVRVGNTTYNVSKRSDSSIRTMKSDRSRTGRSIGSLKRTAR
jgi:hypothetical protein